MVLASLRRRTSPTCADLACGRAAGRRKCPAARRGYPTAALSSPVAAACLLPQNVSVFSSQDPITMRLSNKPTCGCELCLADALQNVGAVELFVRVLAALVEAQHLQDKSIVQSALLSPILNSRETQVPSALSLPAWRCCAGGRQTRTRTSAQRSATGACSRGRLATCWASSRAQSLRRAWKVRAAREVLQLLPNALSTHTRALSLVLASAAVEERDEEGRVLSPICA